MTRVSRLALTVALAACGGGVATTTPAPVAPPRAEPPAPEPVLAPPPAPSLRLTADVAPRRYAVELTIDPAAEAFHGRVAIDVELAAPAGGIWLHARDLAVKQAQLVPAGGAPIPARAMPHPGGDARFLGLALERTAPAGAAQLRIEFSGAQQPVETLGLFRQKDGDDWYSFTQF